ncbi:MAG: hypothetical protein MJZ37_08970 [Bacilli bacterium]|nr:hypothetical protein [Bacilli bacterium]
MPKVYKPGFTYIFSKSLNQEIAVNQKTGKVYCEDGTIYTPEEIAIIREHYGEIPLQVHIIKMKFGGIIVNEQGTNRNQQAESRPAESGIANNTPSIPVQKTVEKMPEPKQGQFDLY